MSRTLSVDHTINSSEDALLSVRNLTVEYPTEAGQLTAIDNLDLLLNKNETYGLVGESGAGKSTVGHAILKMIEEPGEITSGEILYGDHDLLTISNRRFKEIRGNDISMIFQEPTASLNPVLTVGEQLTRVAKRHLGQDLTDSEIKEEILDTLELVQIPNPAERLDSYPVQFSGGMSQRVVIAMALLCEPNILIADEPTTNLDVTIGTHILEILDDISKQRDLSVMFITHDMGIVAQYCDRMGVMYAGKKVEEGPVKEVFKNPAHPYTRDLMNCIPEPNQEIDGEMDTIPGSMVTPVNLPNVCYYANRCEMARDECYQQDPDSKPIGKNETHASACLFADEVQR